MKQKETFFENRVLNQLALDQVEVQRRPLTREEAIKIAQQINDSPTITGYSLSEWAGRRDTFVLLRRSTNKLCGALLAHHMLGNWCEIAVVFIEREYRRNGYGKYLFETSLRTLSYSHKKHLLFFSRPAMEKMARDAGFQVYESEHDFVQKQPLRWLFIKFFYKVQWLSNFYRIRELLRKKREFGSKFHFKIAVLHPE